MHGCPQEEDPELSAGLPHVPSLPCSWAPCISTMRCHRHPDRGPVLWFQSSASPFKDMILCFSEEDWSLLDPGQTGFYGEFIIGEDCGVSVTPCKTQLPEREGLQSKILGMGGWGA